MARSDPDTATSADATPRPPVIPDLASFRERLQGMFEAAREVREGAVADYIPQLGRVDPELFGLAVCTVDGQRFSFGDSTTPFCVQSTSKPLNYCLALEELGAERVHRHVGHEPSGRSFNAMALDDEGLPHNPLINAGGIMSCALIGEGLDRAERFDRVVQLWTRMCGGEKPGFDNATYLSERQTADRNFALGYFMREQGAFPQGADLVETLEFYFQCCSIESNAEAMATLAATLAGGGVQPSTSDRILQHDTVQKCLTLMMSCGMYDYSGEWAFTVGLPAKSGVSGVILVVVPGILGFCIWSPRLDEHGNSVRGIRFCKDLVATYNFHHFDNLLPGRHDKIDPRLPLPSG